LPQERGCALADGEKGSARALGKAGQGEGGVAADGGEAGDGPDQHGEGGEEKEAGEALWAGESSPFHAHAVAGALGVAEGLLSLPAMLPLYMGARFRQRRSPPRSWCFAQVAESL
jgi:hypothetical protein